MIEIYTDGSSTKVRSGWGFVAVVDGTIVYETAGLGQVGDTNQLMEITGVMEACDWVLNSKYIKEHDVIIYSDSAYVVNCYKDKWYANWENNGWKNSKGETVANLLEWRFLIKFFKMPNFDFRKVKGHAGVTFNERADDLAQGKIRVNSASQLTYTKNNDIIYKEAVNKILCNFVEGNLNFEQTVDTFMKLIETIIEREV